MWGVGGPWSRQGGGSPQRPKTQLRHTAPFLSLRSPDPSAWPLPAHWRPGASEPCPPVNRLGPSPLQEHGGQASALCWPAWACWHPRMRPGGCVNTGGGASRREPDSWGTSSGGGVFPGPQPAAEGSSWCPLRASRQLAAAGSHDPRPSTQPRSSRPHPSLPGRPVPDTCEHGCAHSSHVCFPACPPPPPQYNSARP